MKHPELCYVHIATDNSVGIVKWGERGYYKTDFPVGKYTSEIVSEMNEGSGFTDKEIKAMQICSMVNTLPETDEAWQKHYAKILERM